jgi:hypothetical protein
MLIRTVLFAFRERTYTVHAVHKIDYKFYVASFAENKFFLYIKRVLGIRIRMFLDRSDPDLDPLVRGTDPDPSLFS